MIEKYYCICTAVTQTNDFIVYSLYCVFIINNYYLFTFEFIYNRKYRKIFSFSFYIKILFYFVFLGMFETYRTHTATVQYIIHLLNQRNIKLGKKY